MEKNERLERLISFDKDTESFVLKTKFLRDEYEIFNTSTLLTKNSKATDFELLESLLGDCSLKNHYLDAVSDSIINSREVIAFLREGNYIESVASHNSVSVSANNVKNASETINCGYKKEDFESVIANAIESFSYKLRQVKANKMVGEFQE